MLHIRDHYNSVVIMLRGHERITDLGGNQLGGLPSLTREYSEGTDLAIQDDRIHAYRRLLPAKGVEQSLKEHTSRYQLL